MQTTGNDLDVAIKGNGFFAVRDNKGKEAYTRAGDFKMTAEGQLQTGSGLAVLSSKDSRSLFQSPRNYQLVLMAQLAFVLQVMPMPH